MITHWGGYVCFEAMLGFLVHENKAQVWDPSQQLTLSDLLMRLVECHVNGSCLCQLRKGPSQECLSLQNSVSRIWGQRSNMQRNVGARVPVLHLVKAM